MKIKLHNNDSTDSVIYEGETIEDIMLQAKERLKLFSWSKDWSEIIEK